MITRKGLGSIISAAALLAIAAEAPADVLRYIGSTTDWYNPANWDLGRVPAEGDDVLITDGLSVVIDPANDPTAGSGHGTGKVIMKDLSITGGASLETLAGTEFKTHNELVADGGHLIHRSTVALDLTNTGTATFIGGYGNGAVLFNPSTQSKRDVILRCSVIFGLGGTTPASALPGDVGAGHYATINCQTADLTDGALDLDLFYGFTPSLGQTFQIITVGQTLTGQFNALDEGALVRTYGDVGLFISYQGGDGNDVVLTAAAVPAPAAAALLGAGGLLAARRRRRG